MGFSRPVCCQHPCGLAFSEMCSIFTPQTKSVFVFDIFLSSKEKKTDGYDIQLHLVHGNILFRYLMHGFT